MYQLESPCYSIHRWLLQPALDLKYLIDLESSGPTARSKFDVTFSDMFHDSMFLSRRHIHDTSRQVLGFLPVKSSSAQSVGGPRHNRLPLISSCDIYSTKAQREMLLNEQILMLWYKMKDVCRVQQERLRLLVCMCLICLVVKGGRKMFRVSASTASAWQYRCTTLNHSNRATFKIFHIKQQED